MKTTRKYIVEVQTCGTCAHYRQHYILGDYGRFRPIWYGHCQAPQARRPLPDGVCPKWRDGEKTDREPDSQG